jgi:pimeloyl-ACP methyl ester carboxylesterase
VQNCKGIDKTMETRNHLYGAILKSLFSSKTNLNEMRKAISVLVICLIQFIFSFTVYAQNPELTPSIQINTSVNKFAVVKKQSRDVPIFKAVLKENILKSINTSQISYSWGKYLSTSDNDRFYKTTIDATGNIIVVGEKGESSSDVDAVIYKFDGSGNLLWSKTPAASSNIDEIYDVAIDNFDNIYITGRFYSSAFNYQIYSYGGADIFIAKYDPYGTLLWAKNAGGSGYDYGCGITLDNTGNIYAVGFFNGTSYWDGIAKTSSSQGDMFIAKYDTYGNVRWVRTGDVGESNYLFGIGVDKVGNNYVSTKFSNDLHFEGAPVVSSNGGNDMVLIKYDSSGNFKWIKTSGGIGDDGGNKTVVDPDGNILIAGYFSDEALFGNKTLIAHGSFDIFAAKYSSSGEIIWVKQFGGTGSQSAWGLCTDEKSNCYITGWFSGTGAFDNTTIVSSGDADAYLIKYDKNGNLIWIEPTAIGLDKQVGTDVFVKGNDIAISGYYQGEMNIQGSNFPNSGGEDAYLAKLTQSADTRPTVYVNPNLFISVTQVNTGQTITFSGKQFSPAGKVDLDFTGSGTINPVTDLSIDVNGNFDHTLTIPSSQNSGIYQVTATDKISGLSTTKSFQIIQTQSTVVDDYLKILEPNMLMARFVGDPITLAWEDLVKYNVNPYYNFKDSYKVEYKKDANNSSGAWQLIENIQGTNPGYGKINLSTSFTPTEAGSYTFRITDNYYPNRSATTQELVVNGSLDQDIRVEFKWDYNSKWIGTSPEGVAADGVARFYLVISDVNTISSDIQKVKVSLSDPDGYMAPQFLGKVMYCSKQNDDEFSKEASEANSITAENNSSNSDGKYWFWYVAPDDFSRNEGDWDKGERLITANVEVTLLNSQKLSSIQKEIKIARPPLMLVHGLNSNSEAWDNFHTGNDIYKSDPRFKIKKAIDLEPTAHFDVNASHLLAGTEDQSSFEFLIYRTRQAGYASNRVDYICHSMGGAIVRDAADFPEYYNSKNYSKGYVNKLITMDTPHQGSSLANLLDDMANNVFRNGLLISLAELISKKYPLLKFWEIDPFNIRVTDAIADLRYQNGRKFRETTIKSHLIGSGVSCNSLQVNTPTFWIYDILKTYLSFGSINSITDHCTWYQNYFEKHNYELDFGNSNDAVVSLTSQFSGNDWSNMPVNCTRIYGTMHCSPFGDSPMKSSVVWAKVNELLNTKISSPTFDYIDETTVPSTKSAPMVPTKQLAVVEDRINILYPLPNAVYNAGDTITIKLQVDTLGLQNFALIFQDQSFFEKPTKPNLEFKLFVSPEYIEGQNISVFGGYSNHDTASMSNASIDLKVNPVGSIIDFNVKPEVFVIETTKSRRPDYEAIFPNAIAQIGQTDLFTVTIKDPELLEYDNATNQFKGLAKGSTNATITYRGITKTVFFEIIQYEEPPVDPITDVNEINIDKKGQLDFMIYPNPVNNELTIEFKDNTKKIDFEIINSLGQTVFVGSVFGRIVVQTSNFTHGIYLIKLKSGKAFEFKKIVKM